MGIVTIHVFSDNAAGTQGPPASQDYHCEVKLLLRHMTYFKPFLQGVPGENLEISVKCNLQTFDWLMAFVKADITGIQPVLDCSNCIPILIASNYLKMVQLTREAVTFIAANILRLAAAGADIAGLDSILVTKVAKATSEESLEQLLQYCQHVQLPHLPVHAAAGETSSSALLQKLYKHKLEALLQEHHTTLLRCRTCQQLFSASRHKKLQCPALAGQATERLKVLPLHQPDPNWRFEDFLKQQRQHSSKEPRPQQQQVPTLQLQQQQPQHSCKLHSWRDLYWHTWGHVTVLYCQQCHQHFPARQYGHCSSHPLAPTFASEVDAGVYPCCGRPAWRPGLPLGHSQGCHATQHQAALQQPQQEAPPTKHSHQAKQKQQETVSQDAAARAVQLLHRFGNFIMEPYTPPALTPYIASQLPSLAGSSKSAAATTTAAGSSNTTSAESSREASRMSSRPSSRNVGSPSQNLPLLVRMTNRASGSPRLLSDAATGNDTATQQNASSQQEAAGSSSSANMTRAAAAAVLPTSGAAAAAALRPSSGLSRVTNCSTVQAESSEAGSSCASDSGDDSGLNEFTDILDYRSAHLRSFLDAVRAAAQSRDRGGSLLGVRATSAGRLQAELGVPLGNTFSAAGVQRLYGRQSMPSPTQQQQQPNRGPKPPSRQQSPLLPTNLNSKAALHNTRGRPGSAVAAADVQNSRVNRTLLLELMHEDDVYRMSLLMRKLDAVRLQPPPDEQEDVTASAASPSISHLMSDEQVTQAFNRTLFDGVAVSRTNQRQKSRRRS